MEGSSLRSSALSTLPSSFRSGFLQNSLLHAQAIRVSTLKTPPHSGRISFLRIRAQTSGTKQSSSEAFSKRTDLLQSDLAFVAGATGKVGSRTVRELLKLGFRVRAGVRSPQKAENLVQSVRQLKLDSADATESQPVERLEIVKCDLEKQDQIGAAIGNASVVICCIGASEKEILDITGPYRIDYLATKNLIEAASAAKVGHFILLTSLGTNKVGFPAAILNLFWGVLIWKRKAEEALLASGLPYTIVRPGGMERPTDAFKETHNLTLSPEDTLFGGLVSNLQVAELMAFMAKNPGLSYYKVVEVVAETTAPKSPMEELLGKIPSRDGFSVVKESGVGDAPKKPVTADMETAPKKTEPADMETNITEAKPAPTKAPIKKTTPLSPYTAYEDLKPPSSPCPVLIIPSKAPASGSTVVDTSAVANDSIKATVMNVENGAPTNKADYRSPFPIYEDFKPPSSPSPKKPNA